MIDRTHIDRMRERLADVEKGLSDPATQANQKRYLELVREHAGLKRFEAKADAYERIVTDMADHRAMIADGATDADLKELATAELASLEKAFPAAEKDLLFAILPPDPRAGRSAIVEIRAGTGGDEAALFAADLFRMYSKYADSRGWKVSPVTASSSDIGGYKEIVFTVDGEEVYGWLQYESGVHRVQRIPVTEASGRIHTSAATVAVFPEADISDDIEVNPDEIRIDLFCSSGPGGQSVNTTYSAVRITHLPTGLVVQSQDERSQHRNKEKAMAVLKARLLDARRQAEEAKMGTARRSMIGTGDRSERIRTYNFPQNRLTDHRINLTIYSLDRAMEGEIAEVVTALRNHDLELRLKDAGIG